MKGNNMKKLIAFAVTAMCASVGVCAPAVSYKTATNIAHAVVSQDVADWAMKGQPKPTGGGGVGTNDVQALVDASFEGGTNAVKTAVSDVATIKADYLTKSATNDFATTNYVAEQTLKGALGVMPKRLGEYLWEIRGDFEDYDKATNRYAIAYPSYGGCGGYANTTFHARNYDWYYDKSCTFVIRATPRGKYKSIGIAEGIKALTDDFVSSGKWNDSYYSLPFSYVDGMNENGVVIQCNVVPSNHVHAATYQWRTKRPGCVIVFAIIRKALDECATAQEAAQYIIAHNFLPAEFKYDTHYLVSDKTKVIIVEDGEIVANDADEKIMTNFRVKNIERDYDGTVRFESVEQYGLGLERYNILATADREDKESVSGLYRLMKMQWYTKAYSRDEDPFWMTEYTGSKEDTGYDGLTVMNTKNDPSLFINYINESIDTYNDEHEPISANYRGGKSWQTVHTSIYDKNNLAMCLYTQETKKSKKWFYLNENNEKVVSVNGEVGAVTVKSYTPFKDTWHNMNSTMDQLCSDIVTDPDAKAGMCFLGELASMDKMPDENLGNFECLVKICQDGVINFEGYSTDIEPKFWIATGTDTFGGWRAVISLANPTNAGEYVLQVTVGEDKRKTYHWVEK